MYTKGWLLLDVLTKLKTFKNEKNCKCIGGNVFNNLVIVKDKTIFSN